MCSPRSFHPSKEGFKVDYGPENTNRGRGFHPSKEGFKAHNRTPLYVFPAEFPSL